MSSNNFIQYVATYDSAYTLTNGVVSGNPTVLSPITQLQFQRNIAPSEDTATLTLGGIVPIESAREIYIYRVNSNGTYTLWFRGMTTNPTYHSDTQQGQTTEIQINSLWYILTTRLFQVAGKSPPPLQPNTNPYLIYLNPTLQLNFGQIWAMILANAFQESYSTGHLPPLRLENLTPLNILNTDIPYFTDFDNTVVNDNMTIQYQSVSAVIDRLVQSALFNSEGDVPFLAEYRMDIGDTPYTFNGQPVGYIEQELNAGAGSGTNTLYLYSTTGFVEGMWISVGFSLPTEETQQIATVSPTSLTLVSNLTYTHFANEYVTWPPKTMPPYYPTLSVLLFDPVHSALGNGQNKTGTKMGTGQIFTNLDGSENVASTGYYPMSYIEFGPDLGTTPYSSGATVSSQYNPVDTVIYSEGDNIVSLDLVYDYISMNNSWVLTGGSFQGSDVVALPIENQRSIAEFGLKQTNQTLQNVVDPAEIQRYVGTSINFFQYPIPNITLKPDYTYASTHLVHAGDYILINAPSLYKALIDSNGTVIPAVLQNNVPIALTFTARVRRVDITWNPSDGEDITLTLTFPIGNVPLSNWPTALTNSNGPAIQFLYPTVQPTAKTVIGRDRQNLGAADRQGGGDFIANKSSTYSASVSDTGSTGSVVPGFATIPIPLPAQIMPNAISAVNPIGTVGKGDDAMITNIIGEVDLLSGSQANVWATFLQPDGMAIFDGLTAIGQQTNALTLLSKSHGAGTSSNGSFSLLSGLSGIYTLILRNATAYAWTPNPIFSTLPAPYTSTVGNPSGTSPHTYAYLYCPVDANGYEFGMSAWVNIPTQVPIITPLTLTWSAVPNASSYNVYKFLDLVNYDLVPNIWAFYKFANVTTPTYTDSDPNGTGTGTALSQPFDNSYTTPSSYGTGINVIFTSGTPGPNLIGNHYYLYVITSVNPNGTESGYSQVSSPFNTIGSNANTNTTGAQPIANITPEPATPTMIELTWPAIPYTQSYNVYRYDAGTSVPIGWNASNFSQIASGLISPYYLDDGTNTGATGTLLSSNTNTTSIVLSPTTTQFSISMLTSFLPDPKLSKIIGNNLTSNPATSISANPTLQRIYQTNQYVTP